MLCHLRWKHWNLDASSITKTDLKKLPRTSAHSVDPIHLLSLGTNRIDNFLASLDVVGKAFRMWNLALQTFHN